jgi:hypothetical protein
MQKALPFLRVFAIIYVIIGAAHSALFLLLPSRISCLDPHNFAFCKFGIGISHLLITLGWPFYWL